MDSMPDIAMEIGPLSINLRDGIEFSEDYPVLYKPADWTANL